MWRPWSKPLEFLGRLGIGGFGSRSVQVGHPSAADALGGTGWRAYLTPERLYDVWGPAPESPWVPYHSVPLFAALDRIPPNKIGPHSPIEVAKRHERPPAHARPGASRPPWDTANTWTIVDLPGALAVEVGTWLVTAAACQPVCTFDNWPHSRGLLKPEHTLAALLYWATTVAEVRPRLRPSSPPVWICDSERLGQRKGRPGEFDNRYYLDDSILPGPSLLRRAGVREVNYITRGKEGIPTLDLEAYFAELLLVDLPVYHVDLSDTALVPQPFSAPRTPKQPPRAGFRRSAAGGFGTTVPEPSSSGGG